MSEAPSGEQGTRELSKGQKIRRRTIVGGTISLVTAGLFMLVGGESGPFIVHGFAGLLLLGSILEAARTAKDFNRAVCALLAGAGAAWVMTLRILLEFSKECDCAMLPLSSLNEIACASILAAGGFSLISQFISPRRGLLLLFPLCVAGAWLSVIIPDGSRLPVASSSLFLLVCLGANPSETRRPIRAVLEDIARVVWFVPALCWLALLHMEFGQGGLLSLILLSKVGDIFGYFGGSLFGRHHPLPRLSPGKTTEGFACSFFGGVGVGLALAHWGVLPGDEVSLLAGALLGGVMNIAAQVGDLIESMVKRRAKVKDSGTTFGPSGGFLDLLDSFFLTVPVALLIGLLTRG